LKKTQKNALKNGFKICFFSFEVNKYKGFKQFFNFEFFFLKKYKNGFNGVVVCVGGVGGGQLYNVANRIFFNIRN